MDNPFFKVVTPEQDALNVMLRWFGGSMNALDCHIASIPTRLMRDLEACGFARKRLIGWEITQQGRRHLHFEGIKSLSDTRDYPK